VGEVNLVVLACVSRAATTKGRKLFGRKNAGYAYPVMRHISHVFLSVRRGQNSAE